MTIKNSVALNELLKKDTFIEKGLFCEMGYEIKRFEGIKNTVSKKYNFFITMSITNDFRYEGWLEYEIYIPFAYLQCHTGLKSYEEYDMLDRDFNRETEKDYGINDITDFIVDIKGDIEVEILEYLKENDLINI